MFLMESFKEGGWGMYPILILLAITVFIAVDRFFYVSKSRVDVEKLMSLLKSQIVSGNIQGRTQTATLAVQDYYENLDHAGAYAISLALAAIAIVVLVAMTVVRPRESGA